MEGIYLSLALPCAGFWWGSQFRHQSQLQATRLAGGSQFVASSWPVASLLLAHLPSPLQPSLGPFLKWKAPGDGRLEERNGFLIWHWFCSTEMRKCSKYHSGVIYPIYPEGLHWPGNEQAGWASRVKKRQSGLEPWLHPRTFPCSVLSKPRRQSLRAGQYHKMRIMHFGIFLSKPDPRVLPTHGALRIKLISLTPLQLLVLCWGQQAPVHPLTCSGKSVPFTVTVPGWHCIWCAFLGWTTWNEFCIPVYSIF